MHTFTFIAHSVSHYFTNCCYLLVQSVKAIQTCVSRSICDGFINRMMEMKLRYTYTHSQTGLLDRHDPHHSVHPFTYTDIHPVRYLSPSMRVFYQSFHSSVHLARTHTRTHTHTPILSSLHSPQFSTDKESKKERMSFCSRSRKPRDTSTSGWVNSTDQWDGRQIAPVGWHGCSWHFSRPAFAYRPNYVGRFNLC